MDIISTDQAPAAIGPYSQAMHADNLVFCSGQLGIDPATGQLVEGVENQAKQALQNLDAVLQAANSSLSHVAKTTIFLADMADFKAVNTIYSEAFGDHKPARATVQAGALPLNARVEIECIAVVNA